MQHYLLVLDEQYPIVNTHISEILGVILKVKAAGSRGEEAQKRRIKADHTTKEIHILICSTMHYKDTHILL